MKGKRFVTVMVVLAVLLSGAGLAAVAQPLLQGSSDDGVADLSLGSAVVPETAPDMDGYVGPVFQGVAGEGPSSAGELTEELPDWEQFFLEPQLDEDEGAIKAADVGVNWSPIYYYYHAAGSTFRPRNSSVDWANDDSGGCLYLAAGDATKIFNIHLEVPNGSRIEYLRIYYYDTSGSNSTAWVTRYNHAGGLEDVTSVSSASNAGYGTQLGAYLEHVVDSVNYSYVLNWRPVVSGSTMRLCGLRVAYRLP